MALAAGHVGIRWRVVEAKDEEIHAFRLLQHQAVAIGQRRVELQIEMARLEGRRT